MAIPVFTTADDVRRIIAYLKTKPVGVTTKEAAAVLESKLLDHRKTGTYQALGVVERDGDRWRLTAGGRDMARAKDEEFTRLLRQRVIALRPYRSCLEWAYHQNLSDLPVEDIAAHWHDHWREEVGTEKEDGLRERAVCFGQLCEGAGLGRFLVGRRGQSSRLELDRSVLELALAEADGHVPLEGPLDLGKGNGDQERDEASTETVDDARRSGAGDGKEERREAPRQGKGIFIAHGRNKKPLADLKAILDGFKVRYKVAEQEPNLGRPISEKVRQTMDECDAAIIIFTADEELRDAEGRPVWRPSQNVIHELGAAGYLYGKRIVILKDERVSLASNYGDLCYIAFEDDRLAAKAMDVIKELIGFGILKVTT